MASSDNSHGNGIIAGCGQNGAAQKKRGAYRRIRTLFID
jgi:hypothetical protein